MSHQFQAKLDAIRSIRRDLPELIPDDADESYEALGIRDLVASAFKEFGSHDAALHLWSINYDFSGFPSYLRSIAGIAAEDSDEKFRELLAIYPIGLAFGSGEPEELEFECSKLYATQDALPLFPHAKDDSRDAQERRNKYVVAFKLRRQHNYAMYLSLRNLFQSPERNYSSARALASEIGDCRALEIIELVHEGESSWADFGYYAAIQLGWEVFPPGNSGHTSRETSWESRRVDRPPRGHDSLDLIHSYQPRVWYRGMFDTGPNGGQYYIAVFDGCAIAESDHYGNATYITPTTTWQDVFRVSRAEARQRGAQRFKHTEGWEPRILDFLEAEKLRSQSSVLGQYLHG